MYKKTRGVTTGRALLIIAGLLVFVGGYVYTNNPSFFQDLSFLKLGNSCEFPVTYKLDNFDKRFNVSQVYIKDALKEAETHWEEAAGVNLLELDQEDGRVAVNLIFDRRQQETDLLQELGLSIDRSRDAFSQIKARYDSLLATYNTGREEYARSIEEFDDRVRQYEEDVAYWNAKGGASRSEYKRLENEKVQLVKIKDALDQRREALNELATTINSLAGSLNSLAGELNIEIERYNDGGEAIGGEFEQGLYISDRTGEKINIYQFTDRANLVGVLTHELGHALQLDHIDDEQSVMYRLNHGTGQQRVTNADIEALRSKCPDVMSL